MGLTHWKKLDNPDYLGSFAFQPGEKKTLTISHVKRELVNSPDGKREECSVLHFKEQEKPMILNATNGKMISKHANSPYLEDWTGLQIVLGVRKVKAFGEIVDAVRVLDERPAGGQTPVIPHCADCGCLIEAADGYSFPQIIKATKQRFGVILCMKCGNIRKEAEQSE